MRWQVGVHTGERVGGGVLERVSMCMAAHI